MIPEFRRNDASVDSELRAGLPLLRAKVPLYPARCKIPSTSAPTATRLDCTNGILLFRRLDVRRPTIATHLVEQAMAAEARLCGGRA